MSPVPQEVLSATSPATAQLVCVNRALQVVAYDLQGSADAGLQLCPATHAATQAPVLQTWPEPQGVPSAVQREPPPPPDEQSASSASARIEARRPTDPLRTLIGPPSESKARRFP